MVNTIIFSLPDNSKLTSILAKKLTMEIGNAEIRDFPDGDSYIRIDSEVENKFAILICTLDRPNHKILPLLFMAQTLKELGAKKICLVSPYLPYMRQDKRFKKGEAVTSVLFAKIISKFIDCLLTVDPHLHRIHQLSEIYSIPKISTLHATKKIAAWISDNIESPLIIGPDEESQQWVIEVAEEIKAPYAIIKKIRYGDTDVKISIPNIHDTGKTPVLVDDIISTGVSMATAIRQLLAKGFQKPICIGVHAIFSDNAYEELLENGAQAVVTCNTINHVSNKIDITDIITTEIIQWLSENN